MTQQHPITWSGSRRTRLKKKETDTDLGKRERERDVIRRRCHHIVYLSHIQMRIYQCSAFVLMAPELCV